MPRSGAAPNLRSGSLGLLPLFLALAGCSGTPLGEALSRSFPGAASPPPAAPTTKTAPGASASTATPTPSPSPLLTPANGRPADGAKTTPKAASGTPSVVKDKAAAPSPPPPSPVRPASTTPTPYRVTLRLPQADPAAPAEGLTEALRAAGVPFEVETIERLPGGTSASGSAAGGSATVAPATPQVRPAPPVP